MTSTMKAAEPIEEQAEAFSESTKFNGVGLSPHEKDLVEHGFIAGAKSQQHLRDENELLRAELKRYEENSRKAGISYSVAAYEKVKRKLKKAIEQRDYETSRQTGWMDVVAMYDKELEELQSETKRGGKDE